MINYDLQKIRAIIFDVDGVLSCETIPMAPDGLPMRTVNIKDGYALQLAVKLGLHIAIITGANVPSVRVRYEGLGLTDVFIGCSVKIKTYEEFMQKYGLKDVSDRRGGQGCARDVIEQTLRAKGLWQMNATAFGW